MARTSPLDQRLSKRGYAPNTQRTYAFQAEHLDGARTARELAETLHRVCAGAPQGTVCVRKAVAMHQAVADFGSDRELRDILARDFPIKGNRSAAVPGLDAAQLGLLHAGLRETPPSVRLCLYTMLFCGLRCAESRGLLWRDVDLANGTIRIKGKGGTERIVPLPATLARALAGLSRASAYVFPGRDHGSLSESGVWNHVRRLRGSAPELRGFHPHQLRHNFAEACLAAGVALTTIKELLGHASINTTAIYARSTRDVERAAVDAAADRLGGLPSGAGDVHEAPQAPPRGAPRRASPKGKGPGIK